MLNLIKNRWINVLETLYLFSMTGLSIYFAITILLLVGHRHENFSQWYIILYGGGAVLFTFFMLYCTIVSAFRIPDERIFDFGFVAERDKYRFLSSVTTLFGGKQIPAIDLLARLAPHFGMLVFTLMLAGATGAIFPVPNAFGDGGYSLDSAVIQEQMSQVEETYAVSKLEQSYYISLPVGFVEEGIILMLIEVLVLFMIVPYLFVMLVSRKELKVPAWLHIIFIVFATFIASLGYLVIPGFMDAHSAAYGANSAAYFKAFIFEFAGQLVNQFTGLFVSWIPHALHNFVVSYFMIAGLSIGGTALGVMWLAKIKKKKGVKLWK